MPGLMVETRSRYGEGREAKEELAEELKRQRQEDAENWSLFVTEWVERQLQHPQTRLEERARQLSDVLLNYNSFSQAERTSSTPLDRLAQGIPVWLKTLIASHGSIRKLQPTPSHDLEATDQTDSLEDRNGEQPVGNSENSDQGGEKRLPRCFTLVSTLIGSAPLKEEDMDEIDEFFSTHYPEYTGMKDQPEFGDAVWRAREYTKDMREPIADMPRGSQREDPSHGSPDPEDDTGLDPAKHVLENYCEFFHAISQAFSQYTPSEAAPFRQERMELDGEMPYTLRNYGGLESWMGDQHTCINGFQSHETLFSRFPSQSHPMSSDEYYMMPRADQGPQWITPGVLIWTPAGWSYIRPQGGTGSQDW